MMTKEAFIDFILKGPEKPVAPGPVPERSALPEGLDGFDPVDVQPRDQPAKSSFARRLLEASGFELAKLVETKSLIRSTDAVVRFLPERAAYWPKTAERPFQTILFEADHTHKDLQAIPAFRGHSIAHLELAEDALARLADEALQGFQKRGQTVTAETLLGSATETLCIVSILDEREATPARLVCFATYNKHAGGGLETFQITEAVRSWEPQLAHDHLGLLYERQFRKLAGVDWQDAFTTTEERKQAGHLLDVCTGKGPTEKEIQEAVIELLEMIAKSFGLRKMPNARRLQAFALPADHDIGIDSEERESKFGGKNPFGGVTLRDEKSRLLGYIVYPLKSPKDAARLRKHLEENNRFHNVLVVYPHAEEASLELWQGQEQLTGKLRKNHGYKDAADVVNLLSRFFVVSKAKVKNPTELAQELAYRARYLRRLAITELNEEDEGDPLRRLYGAFKEALVHDQEEDEFADAFAQTLTYGLLTARWLGSEALAKAGERFTRQTALKHLPATSPFLTDLFRTVLRLRLDEQRGRLLWLVDDIADLLDRVAVTLVFGKGDADSDQSTDPVIHFYEPFLAAYDKELKNKRGVFFTPRPVVSYIVRSVHELLQSEFGLEDGLASTDTWGDVAKRFKDLTLPQGVKAEDPFVCILDPATGTGTFLYECIEVIERTMKDRWCRELKKKDWKDPAIVGRWNEYVPKYLLPRLYGYELMMASYAVAHLKLAFKLLETGYYMSKDRLNVYLTNSLDPPSPMANPKLAGLFETLGAEAQNVNREKRERRFTVVMGNPPYSVSSWNDIPWIDELAEDYKRNVRKEESQIQALSNDYIKFLRYGQHLVEQSRVGILAMITGHGYLQGTQPRDLRQALYLAFDKLFFLDLHGSIRRTIASSDVDEPVFQITTGVAIILGARTAGAHDGSSASAVARQTSIVGPVSEKFRALAQNTISSLHSKSAAKSATAPYFYFARLSTDQDIESEYRGLIDLPTCFGSGNRQQDKETYWATGFASQQDELAISFTREEVAQKMEALAQSVSFAELQKAYRICTTDQWDYNEARRFARAGEWREHLGTIMYRPFDRRWTVLHRHVLTILRKQVMSQLGPTEGDLGLVSSRAVNDLTYAHCFVVDAPVDKIFISSKTSTNAYVFPTNFDHNDMYGKQRRPNFSRSFLSSLALALSITRLDPVTALPEGIPATSIFKYIYAILHSPEYRRRYGEFLKIDFPRIALPRSRTFFGEMAHLGASLLALHLLRQVPARQTAMRHGERADAAVGKVSYSDQTVWSDKKKTFGFKGVPEEVWNFRIGGYKVCEKWLKDRKGRTLSKDDIDHYQKIVAAISETIRIMKEIDEVIEKHGGWPGAFVTSAEVKP